LAEGVREAPRRAQRTPEAVTADLQLGFELRSMNLNQETTTDDRMTLLALIEKRAHADLVLRCWPLRPSA